MNYEIKTAVETHSPAVIDLLREFAEFEKLSHEFLMTPEKLHAAVFGENAFVRLLVAETGGETLGYALLYPKFASFRGERSLYLEDLYVRPTERGKGLGLALLKAGARMAKNEGFQRLDWQALKWNAPAIEFYRKIGAESDDGNVNFRLVGETFERLAS